MAALERLQSMGPESGSDRPGKSAAPSGRGQRSRLRPAGAASGLPIARIAAPAVFLVAVIVLISLLFQSGVIGGEEETRVAQPTPTATKAKAKTASPKATAAGSTTKIYVVKAGDTPSGIADRYGITLSELEELNPNSDFTTLVVGQKLKVPRQ
jgi:hypothetical protein